MNDATKAHIDEEHPIIRDDPPPTTKTIIMKTTCEVDIIEDHDMETKIGDLGRPQLTVENHRDDDSLVVINIFEDIVTVRAKELRTAIDNCTNSAPRSEPKIQIRGEDIANTLIFLRSLKAEIIASDFDSES